LTGFADKFGFVVRFIYQLPNKAVIQLLIKCRKHHEFGDENRQISGRPKPKKQQKMMFFEKR